MGSFSKLRTFSSTFVLASSVLLIGGCTDRFTLAPFEPDVNTYGADPLLDPKSLQRIDLAKLLDAGSKGLTPVGINDQKKVLKDANNQDVLKRAFDEFAISGTKAERTRIQERIVAASDQRCEAYFKFIKRYDVQTNVFFNSVTTLLGGLGAIFTGADTVRALSGSAAIFSGWGAVSNDAFFQDLTVQVITNGIKLRRTDIHEDMARKRDLGLPEYPAEAAVRDAIRYHASCSLVAGLEQAALELDRAEDPGVRQMQRTLFETRRLQLIADLSPEELLSEEVQDDLARGFPGRSPESVAGRIDEVPADVWRRAETRIRRAVKLVEGALSGHETDIINKHANKEIDDTKKQNALAAIGQIRERLSGKDKTPGIGAIVDALLNKLNLDEQGKSQRHLALSNAIEEQAHKLRRADAKARKVEKTILETLRSDAENSFNRPVREVAEAYADILGKANSHIADGQLKAAEDVFDWLTVRNALCNTYYSAKLATVDDKKIPDAEKVAICKAPDPRAKAAKGAAGGGAAGGDAKGGDGDAKKAELDKDAKRLTTPFVRLGSFDPKAIGDEKAAAAAAKRRDLARGVDGLIPSGMTIQAWQPENILVVDLGSFKNDKEAEDFCNNPLLDKLTDGFKKGNDCAAKLK